MKLSRNHVEWISLVFFLLLTAVVFQQISTDLVEQGIADGDPFHNAAFYPRAIAIIIIGIVCTRAARLTVEIKNNATDLRSKGLNELFRPVLLVCLFALYLSMLGVLGYHLTTAPFLLLVTLLCRDKAILYNVLFSITAAFLIAYLFEKHLRIVLPVGIFSISIPW